MLPKTIVVIAGLPTTGKTTLGRALAKETGLYFIDIDEGPANCVFPQETNPYGSDESCARERGRMAIAYSVLHAAVEANLLQGFSVIVSATYSRYISQDFLKQAIERGNGIMKIILCQYNDVSEEIERRVANRLSLGAVGGCRSVSHYLDDKKRYAGMKFPHIVVMMEGGKEGLNKAVWQAMAYIQ